jgi:hypothetical protein
LGRKALLGHLLRITVAICIALAGFEIVSDNRIVIPPTRPVPSLPLHQGKYLEYVTPFGETRTRTWKWQNDQFGMRYGAARRELEPGSSIALVGDSFSWGAESDYPETLEPLLEAKLPGVGVLNFSLCGASTAEYPANVSWYGQRINRIGLKALVIGVYTDLEIGDLPRLAARERYGARVPYRDVDISAAEAAELSRSWLSRADFDAILWLHAHSSTFNVLAPPHPSPYFAISLANRLTETDFPRLAEGLRSRLSATTEAAGLTPRQAIIWLIPSNHVLHAQYEAQQQHTPLSGFYSLSLEFWDYAAAEIEKAGFQVLDFRPGLNEAFLHGGPYPYTVSGHFAGATYASVAEGLASAIKRVLGE